MIPTNTLKIQDLVLRLKKKGVTSVFVTHDMPTAMNVCDRFCLLANGRVMDQATVEEVKLNKGGKIEQFIAGEVGG